MPIHSYTCRACGEGFSTLVRSSDVPTCPKCESADLERELSLIAKPQASSDDFGTCTAGDTPGPRCGGCPALAS